MSNINIFFGVFSIILLIKYNYDSNCKSYQVFLFISSILKRNIKQFKYYVMAIIGKTLAIMKDEYYFSCQWK